MPTHDITVIGGSSGAIETLIKIVRDLPRDIPAALFVVVHLSPKSEGSLPGILTRSGTLTAVHAEEGAPVRHGKIYVAPPDFHLVLHNGFLRVTRGPKENNHRPAIDPLFRSAAVCYGPRAVGVLLSGNLDDGKAGLLAIKQRGGVAIVQDPEDALFPAMPRNALTFVKVDYSLPAAEIAPLLSRLACEKTEISEESETPVAMKNEINREVEYGRH